MCICRLVAIYLAEEPLLSVLATSSAMLKAVED